MTSSSLYADLPLTPDRFTFVAKFGIAPSFYSSSGAFRTKFSNPLVVTEKEERVKRFSFGDAFRFPFAAGADFGFALMPDIEIFLNAEFLHGNGRRIKLSPKPLLRARFADFNHVAGYLGARYYFDICEWVSPFVGAKAGYVFREKIQLRLNVDEPGVINNEIIKKKFAHGSSAFGGGLQLGLDFINNEIFSIQLLLEAVTSTKLNSKKKSKELVYRTTSSGTYTGTIRLSRTPKTTFSFPMTLGCKFRF